jgi:hypothetical protein
MSSRLTRTLLRLYPRRIRDRYGEELLDLEDELTAQGEVSRMRLIRDMLTGAVLIRLTRPRALIVTGAVLVVVGLVVAGTIIGGRGTDTPARASHPRVRLVAQSLPANALPYGSCFIVAGSACSLTPCTEFIGRSSGEDAVSHSSLPGTQRRRRVSGTRCVAHPHTGPQNLVVVARPARPTRRRQ